MGDRFAQCRFAPPVSFFPCDQYRINYLAEGCCWQCGHIEEDHRGADG